MKAIKAIAYTLILATIMNLMVTSTTERFEFIKHKDPVPYSYTDERGHVWSGWTWLY